MRELSYIPDPPRAQRPAITRTAQGLALYGALHATFTDVHPACDQILQNSADAIGKGKPGPEGRRHCARHVASYTAGQTLAAILVTRALGYRLPFRALAAGMALNAATHYAIDRREPFIRLMRRIGKGGYLDHATVQRREGVVDTSGPGTALMECDQATHRAIGVAASLITTWIAMRSQR
ncbi:hypothetical protein [Amycolatopsis pigmentata]|uniref:DUF3307 domain-containing protein n=1 Tax=Amycolatopsis pigmentata TaxID=450801 RepID=A0ABW5G3V5_9PSEU